MASLNHPHIGVIYGLEDADGVRALVPHLHPTPSDRHSRLTDRACQFSGFVPAFLYEHRDAAVMNGEGRHSQPPRIRRRVGSW